MTGFCTNSTKNKAESSRICTKNWSIFLGSSLEDLFNFCQRKFSLKTVLLLADQMVTTKLISNLTYYTQGWEKETLKFLCLRRRKKFKKRRYLTHSQLSILPINYLLITSTHLIIERKKSRGQHPSNPMNQRRFQKSRNYQRHFTFHTKLRLNTETRLGLRPN